MAAISVSYTAIPGADYDPDSPLTTGLFTDIIDNITYCYEWIGASYTAGAEQDHDHDGANSAYVSGTVVSQGYGEASAPGGGTDIDAVTISSVTLAANQRLEVIGTIHVDNGANTTDLTIELDGITLETKVIPASVESDWTIYAESTSADSGDLILNIASAGTITDSSYAQLKYWIYAE